MHKSARLDQVLLRLGYVTQEQVANAVSRQKEQGGRFGMNLVQLGYVTEEQLLTALSKQFGVPEVVPDVKTVAPELVSRLPKEIVAEGRAVPLEWDEAEKTVSLAVADLEDTATLKQVKDSLGARAVRVALAAQSVLAALGQRLTSGEALRLEDELARGIKLPDLFAAEEVEPGDEVEEPETDLRRALMVTAAASRKNFLPPLFRREGCELTVVSDEQETKSALNGPAFDVILVSEEMEEVFALWRQSGHVPTGDVEPTIFSSLSASLLDNPLPYELTSRSLRAAVQSLADLRCGQHGASPAYGLIAGDADMLAEDQGLGQVARDGLHVGAHLLLPVPDVPEHDWSHTGEMDPFDAFASSLELATRLRFPWRLDALLAACHALYMGRSTPAESGDWAADTHLAAQILALVWYRHNYLPDPGSTEDEEIILELRTALRRQAGSLASTDLVEAYLRLLAERGGLSDELDNRGVLLVGGDRIFRALSPALLRVGRETSTSRDLGPAQKVMEEQVPGAVVVDYEAFPGEVGKFSRVTKLGGSAALFVLTDSTDPSLVFNLLDVGVDDVFGPPHDFDLVAARINRAIRSRAPSTDRSAEADGTGQFSATFHVFSFLDLIQMLSQGLKTVRIDLSRDAEEKAVMYMRKGRITHALVGDLEGAEAVYRVIAWQDEGEFTVREETEFPTDTIQESTESLLMEGCRLLDERGR